MREIQLTRGVCAIVDDEDYEWLSQWFWWAGEYGSTMYAGRNVQSDTAVTGRTSLLMHVAITGAPAGARVDHRDGNGLNNQRANLRMATHAENMRNQRTPTNNTSGHKGVSRHKQGRWEAKISVDGQRKYLGLFDTAQEAALAYNAAALEYHGEFARLNEV